MTATPSGTGPPQGSPKCTTTNTRQPSATTHQPLQANSHKTHPAPQPRDLNPAPTTNVERGRPGQTAQHTTPQRSEVTGHSGARKPPPTRTAHPTVHRPATQELDRPPASCNRTCVEPTAPGTTTTTFSGQCISPPANPRHAGARPPNTAPRHISRLHRRPPRVAAAEKI